MAAKKMVYEAGDGVSFIAPSVIAEALGGPGILDYKIETSGFMHQRVRKLEVVYSIKEEGNAEDRPA